MMQRVSLVLVELLFRSFYPQLPLKYQKAILQTTLLYDISICIYYKNIWQYLYRLFNYFQNQLYFIVHFIIILQVIGVIDIINRNCYNTNLDNQSKRKQKMYDLMNNQKKLSRMETVDSGLQFKPHKKRSSKRASRSKSTFTSTDDNVNEVNHNVKNEWNNIFTGQTERCNTDRYGHQPKFQMKDKTNQNFDYGRLKNYSQIDSKQPSQRTPKKLRQQQSCALNLNNFGYKIPALNFSHSLSYQQNTGNEHSALSQFDKKSFKNFEIKYDQYYNSFNKTKNQEKIVNKYSLQNSPRQFGKTCEFGYRRQRQIQDQNKQNLSLAFNQYHGHHRTRTEDLCLSNTCSALQFDQKYSKTKNFKKSNNFMNKIISINQSLPEEQSTCFKLKDFQLGLCSGQDMFGKTYPARHIKSGMILCIKQVSKRQVQFQLDKFVQALKIQCFCSRDYIVNIYGFFQQGNRLYIIMEYHNQGNLFYTLKSADNQLKPHQILFYFTTICRSISQLHSNQILYRNLKSQKLSLVHDTCKISNLNWSARQISHKTKGKCNFMADLEYSAPEILANNGKYTKEAQIWAIGILFHQIYYGVTPTHNMSSNQAKKFIINGQLNLDAGPCKIINNLLVKILQKDPKLRPTIYELISIVQQAQKKLQVSQSVF